MRDPRSIPSKLMRGPLESYEEYASLRLYYRMRDPRSTPSELVRGSFDITWRICQFKTTLESKGIRDQSLVIVKILL
jgi:hypothetical protein